MRKGSVQEIIDYIEGNITDEISLMDIADRVNYSPYYCSASFRRYTGTSIKNYILKRRLQRAAEDLASTKQRGIDIALRYGYSTQEAFSRAFLKFYGISPYEYRKKKLPLAEYGTKGSNNMNNDGAVVNMKGEIINNIQAEIKERYPENVLHVLSGGCMLEDFKNNNRTKEGHVYIPFNEAMCWGEAHEDIFSDAFIDKRASAFKVDQEQYRKITIDVLEPLLKGDFDTIVLWFGDDMFCGINMLTVLALLDKMDFGGDVLFCVAIEYRDDVLPDAYEIEVEGSYQLYKKIMCKGEMPKEKVMPVMYQAISMYLSYRDENSEINRYIRNHISKEKNELIREMFKVFPNYGLGDMQYEMMIDEISRDMKY